MRHPAALRAVAQEGSFGAAATRLGYTQSAVSQQIATLERAAGERLVDRPGGPRRVSLTDAGQVLLRHAERIVAGMEAAWADLEALSSGGARTVRVGTYQSVGAKILPELMCRLVAQRPGMEVVPTESGSDRELLDLLERGEMDLAFSVLPLPDGPFEGVEMMRDPYVLLLAADDPLAQRAGSPALADLEGLPMIGFRTCVAGERTDEYLRAQGVELRTVFRSDDNGTLQGLVGAGMAVALVPLLAADRSDPRVAVLPMGGEVPERLIALAWHRDRALSPGARAFIACARELCADMHGPVWAGAREAP